MPFKESIPGKETDEEKTEVLFEKHAEGTELSGRERGFLSRMIGKAKRAGDEEQAQRLQEILREQGAREKADDHDPGVRWTHRSNPDLHTSFAVRQANRYHAHREKEKEKRQEQAVEVYLNRLEEIITQQDEEERERGIAVLRKLLHRHYIIKADEIPESYYESQQRRAREEGHGDVAITEDMREELAEVIRADQESTLDLWFDYLTSSDALYPMWTKYWAMKSVLTLGRYDKERKQFAKRDHDTVAPFPDLNREALAYVTDIIQKKVKKESVQNPAAAHERSPVSDEAFHDMLNTLDFGKYYAFAMEHVTVSNEMLFENITGQWITYPQGSDHMPLVESLQGHGTGWCTAGEETARNQLQHGDFHVYYSNNLLNDPVIPRVAIRMEDSSIAEVRGVGSDQNFDPYITPVVEEKLTEFPDGSQYQQQVEDMRYLTEISAKQELAHEDLLFLYEIDKPIISPGYQPDPRIEEIRSTRDPRKDLASLFTCREDQISLTEEEALSGNIVYHHGNLYLGGLTSAEGLTLPETVGGDLDLSSLTSAEGLILPETVGGYLYLNGLTSAEGLTFPESVGGDLDLSSLTSAEGLTLPASVGGYLYLSGLTSAEGLTLPETVRGGLYLSGLTSAEGLILPETVRGNLYLNGLTSAEGLTLPESLGGNLHLSGLTSAEGITLPASVRGSLYLSGLTSAEGLTLPETVSGGLYLSGLTSAEGLTLPKTVRGGLYLDGLTSAEGLTLPASVGGNLDLRYLTSAEGLTLPESVGGDLYLDGLSEAEREKIRNERPDLASSIM